MTCESMRDLIPLAAGGEAPDNERIAVEAHVAVCSACAREMADYRGLISLVGSLREGDVPAGTFERIQRAVLPRPARTAVAAGGWWMRAAAALLIGLTVGFSAKTLADRGAQPEPAARAPESGDATWIPGGVMPAGTASPFMRNPNSEIFLRFDAPRRAAPRHDGTYYLPRVESLVNPDETDF